MARWDVVPDDNLVRALQGTRLTNPPSIRLSLWARVCVWLRKFTFDDLVDDVLCEVPLYPIAQITRSKRRVWRFLWLIICIPAMIIAFFGVPVVLLLGSIILGIKAAWKGGEDK